MKQCWYIRIREKKKPKPLEESTSTQYGMHLDGCEWKREWWREMTIGWTRDSIKNGTLKVKEILYLRHAIVLFLIQLHINITTTYVKQVINVKSVYFDIIPINSSSIQTQFIAHFVNSKCICKNDTYRPNGVVCFLECFCRRPRYSFCFGKNCFRYGLGVCVCKRLLSVYYNNQVGMAALWAAEIIRINGCPIHTGANENLVAASGSNDVIFFIVFFSSYLQIYSYSEDIFRPLFGIFPLNVGTPWNV